MKRDLKILGLALCTALMVSAISASAAAALVSHHVKTVSGSELSVVENKRQEFFPTTNDPETALTCEEVGTTGKFTTILNTEITVTSTYENCKAHSGTKELHATVLTNGCHFTFTGDTTHTEGETAGDHAIAHLSGCEGEKGIEVNVTFLNLPCLHIPEQTLHGIKYAQKGEDIEIQATIHGVHSTTTEVCEEEGEPAEDTHTDGVFLGNVVVRGTSPLELVTTEE